MKFGNIPFGVFIAVTIGFKSTKSIKGIMQLVNYDKEQDMLIFERAEYVGGTSTATSYIHVFLPEVSMIQTEFLDDGEYRRDVHMAVQNLKAIQWMSNKTYRKDE